MALAGTIVFRARLSPEIILIFRGTFARSLEKFSHAMCAPALRLVGV
jgi:hypothetical protein